MKTRDAAILVSRAIALWFMIQAAIAGASTIAYYPQYRTSTTYVVVPRPESAEARAFFRRCVMLFLVQVTIAVFLLRKTSRLADWLAKGTDGEGPAGGMGFVDGLTLVVVSVGLFGMLTYGPYVLVSLLTAFRDAQNGIGFAARSVEVVSFSANGAALVCATIMVVKHKTVARWLLACDRPASGGPGDEMHPDGDTGTVR